MRFGIGELLVIFAIALFVLGPDKLPEYTRKLGVALKEFRKVTGDATKDIRENIVEPLNEAQRPLREALEPLDEIRQDIDHDVNNIKNSLNSATSIAPVRKVARKNEETGEIEEVPVDELPSDAKPKPPAAEAEPAAEAPASEAPASEAPAPAPVEPAPAEPAPEAAAEPEPPTEKV